MDDVLAAADINVLIVASRNLYSARLGKKKKIKNAPHVIKLKHFCRAVKCILKYNDNLDPL